VIDYRYRVVLYEHEGKWCVVCDEHMGRRISPWLDDSPPGDKVLSWIEQHEREAHARGRAEAHSDEPTRPADVLVAPRPGGRFQVCLSNPIAGLSFELDRAGAVKLRDQLNIALRAITDGNRNAGGDAG
jgi:hypothetical protein